MKIKVNDTVKIRIGKDKGRTGTVLKSFPKKGTLLVEGINLYKKHLKPQQGQPGSIVERTRPIAVCKVSLVCPSCKKATRVAYKIDKNKEKYRVCKKCDSIIKIDSKK